MQYLNRSEQYIEPSLTIEERARKASAARLQQTLFERQATFDNFGIPRPTLPKLDEDPYLEWLRTR
jgi:hypothetical protein